jgi:calcium-dependent protein kinase
MDPICDMWSAGIIMYVLIHGQLPFKDVNKDKMKSILNSKSLFSPIKGISKVGFSFMKCLLEFEHAKRISPEEALKHPWFKKKIKTQEVIQEDESSTLGKIERFKVSSK